MLTITPAALARGLVPRLVELNMPPRVACSLCTWLATVDDAVERIDAGERFVLISAVGYVADLFTLERADAVAKKAPHKMIGVDMTPLLEFFRTVIEHQHSLPNEWN